METEVARAALALVQPTTDGVTRREASSFLEGWTRTPEAVGVYSNWLASYRQQSTTVDPNQIPMQLLCLTMLQTKLRNELPRNATSMAALQQELWEYLKQQPDRSLIGPCCICNVICIIRTSGLAMFLTKACNQSLGLTMETTLKLIASVPAEMESYLTTSKVVEGLSAYVEAVLELIRSGLDSPSTLLPSCQALLAWTEIAKISLTQMNTPIDGGPSLLPMLIRLLSVAEPTADERVLQTAAKALTACIDVSSDAFAPTRQVAAAKIWNAIPQTGLVVNPLKLATEHEWEDCVHALSTLVSTFVVEHAEDICQQPAGAQLQILLEIQSHPFAAAALTPLECWLTIQEIPTAERHEHWRKPLYQKLLEILLRRMAFPEKFTTWENELVDESEFQEFRRLVADVFVGCYYLLRVEMIQLLAHQIRAASDWRHSEAALFCLSQIAKEVSAKCKSVAPTPDKQQTQQELLQLLEQVLGVDTKAQHQQLLGAVVDFCGNYAPAWNCIPQCSPQALLQILSYLQSTFSIIPRQASNATRNIYVTCLAKKLPDLEAKEPACIPLLCNAVKSSMEAILSTTDEEAMTTVTEGATRLLTKIQNPETARQAITNDLIQPVLDRIDAALKLLPSSNIADEWMTAQVQSSTEYLSKYMGVLRILVRFCDSPTIPAMTEWMLQLLDPCLKIVQQKTFSTPAQALILSRWISIHQQILRKTLPQPSTMMTIFTNTIPIIVQALEHTQDPTTLKYVTTAVEVFGGQTPELDQSFQELLGHVTCEIQRNTNILESMELLQAYFECLHRFVLYCPRALCYNPKFSDILQVAVGSVSAIDAKDSARAALVFLSQLFGWNVLRLSNTTTQVLQDAWNALILKEMILRHGPTLLQSCFAGLAGGSQMLWPAYSDCVFAIVQAVAHNQQGGVTNPSDTISPMLNETSLQQWLVAAMTADGSDTSIASRIVPILVAFGRNGSKSRAKAKMLLTDYAKIRSGELTIESLVSYSSP